MLFGSPVATIRASAPAAGVVALFAEELRRGGLRVRVDADGRSLRAKTRLALALNLLQILNPVELFSSPTFTVRVLEEGPAGSVLEVAIRTPRGEQMRHSVPAALNRAFTTLRAHGVGVDIGPWDRWMRGRRVPV
jgi:hypothetical protein